METKRSRIQNELLPAYIPHYQAVLHGTGFKDAGVAGILAQVTHPNDSPPGGCMLPQRTAERPRYCAETTELRDKNFGSTWS